MLGVRPCVDANARAGQGRNEMIAVRDAEETTDVSWCRLEDNMDENRKLRRLSHEPFRLYWIAVTYARRHGTGGRLHADDVHDLCVRHRIRNVKAAVAELLYVPTEYGFEAGCWEEVAPGTYQIHDHEEYNPPTSKERMRRMRERDRPSPGDADVTAVTSQPVTSSVTRDAIGDGRVTASDAPRAQERAGYPDPVPEPVPVAPSGATKGLRPEAIRALVPARAEGDAKVALGDRLAHFVGDSLGRTLSVLERERVQGWAFGFWRLSEQEIQAAVAEVIGKYQARDAQVRTVALFEGRLADLQAAVVDGQTARPSGGQRGFTRAADVLGEEAIADE